MDRITLIDLLQMQVRQLDALADQRAESRRVAAHDVAADLGIECRDLVAAIGTTIADLCAVIRERSA